MEKRRHNTRKEDRNEDDNQRLADCAGAQGELTEGRRMSMLCDNCTAERCADRGKGQVIFCTSHATKPKPMTNLERYRAQLATDEGLAEFLMLAHDGEVHIPFCRSDVVCEGEHDPMGEGCKACMMEWLKKPMEEGEK